QQKSLARRQRQHARRVRSPELLRVRFQDRERLAALTVEIEQDAAFWIRFAQGFAEGPYICDGFSVHLGDHVLALDSLRGCDAVICDICHDYAPRIAEMETLRYFLRNILDLQPQFPDIFRPALLRRRDLVRRARNLIWQLAGRDWNFNRLT